ncbi:hypothetical protein [Cyclobacterium plantarum]|uniref:Histidine kinase N-terminal 7TM region domain-containing protein n=1 Tax=Cyclobacterium plantarum TaxID=2716263 RepID=A0ABX0H792_9BACT|nr:hypothetical protein [Cyclobacterium plantarum]NHE57750.1 hypothetical protein [Cyclobacterium plantarum]
MEFGELVAYFVLSLAIINAIILILAGKRAKVSQQYMGFALLFFSGFLFTRHNEFVTGWLAVLMYFLMLCVGPFFYFFIRNSLTRYKRNNYLDLLHFLPLILLSIPVLLILARKELPGFLFSSSQGYQPVEIPMPGGSALTFVWSHELLLCSLLIYYLLGLRLLFFAQPINIHYSEQRKVKRWLTWICCLFGLLLILFSLSQDYVESLVEQKLLPRDQVMPVVLLVLTVAMHFKPNLVYGFDFGESPESR